jgi:hypothetical protein
VCDSGPYLCAFIATCHCGHTMCEDCKKDNDIPPPLSVRDLDWNTESRSLAFNNQAGRSIQDSAQTDVLPNAHSTKSPDPSQNEDEDHLRGGIAERIPDDVSVLSSSVGVFPEVDLWGTVTDASQERLFKAILNTGSSICTIAERVVADRFGIDQIDKRQSYVLEDIEMSPIRTLGRIRITVRFDGSRKRYNVPFEVLPGIYVMGRFDALLSDKFIERTGLLVRYTGWTEKDEDFDERNKKDSAATTMVNHRFLAVKRSISSAFEALGVVSPSKLAYAKDTKEHDSDEESVAPSVFSGTSEATMASTNMEVSEGGEEAIAARELFYSLPITRLSDRSLRRRHSCHDSQRRLLKRR